MSSTALRQLCFAALILSILLVIGIGLTAYRDSEQFDAELGDAQRSERVLDASRDVVNSVRDAETNQLKYKQTGRENYRLLYADAVDRAAKDLVSIQEKARQPGKDQEAARQLQNLVTQKLTQLKQSADARARVAAAVNQADVARDKRALEQIATLGAQLAGPASARPEDSVSRLAIYARETWMATLLGSLVLLLLLSGIMYAMHLAFSRRERLIQKLKRAAESSAAVQDQWRTTLRSIGEAVIATDSDGVVTFSNETAQALTGWTAEPLEEVHLDKMVRLVDADTREPAESALSVALRSGRPGGPTSRSMLMRRDGSAVPIDINGAPVRDEAGKVLGAVLVFRDITARRKTELDAEEAVGRYKAMLDSIGDGFMALDETFRFIYSNGKAATLLGIGAGELRGRVLWAELPGFSNSRVGKSLIRAMLDRAPLEMEEEHGGRWLSIRAYPGSKGLTLYLADATNQQARMTDAARQEERNKRSLSAARAATWEYDIAAGRMEWSETAKELFGGAESACPRELVERMVQGPPSDFRIVRNGEERWVSWLGQPVQTGDGEPSRLAGILIDVTARKRQDAQLV